tara:strand:- start:209 stop:1090 length:882 start_codon:yes stop_codon:yes gene_type:complete
MLEMPNLIQLIPESKKLIGATIPDLLNTFLNFENKVLIMFDVETLGLNPGYDYEQITEIAACAISGDTMQELKKINFKVELSESAKELLENTDSIQRFNWERRQSKRGKTAFTDPNELLKMTHYYEIKSKSETEEFAIKKFYEFVEQYEDVILVAHNANFDVSFVNTRGNQYQLKFPTTTILDTLRLSQFFFVPTVETLKTSVATELYERLSRKNRKRIHISSRLGDLADAFKINSEMWHSASADVDMMNQVMVKIIKFLETNKQTNIKLAQEKAIYRTLKKKRIPRKRGGNG